MTDPSLSERARPPVVLVVGAGDAGGGAVARRLAREGFVAYVTRRDAERSGPRVANELEPRCLHGAHMIVDGMIETAFIQDNFLTSTKRRSRSTAFFRPTTSRRTTGGFIANPVTRGRSRSIFDRMSSPGERDGTG